VASHFCNADCPAGAVLLRYGPTTCLQSLPALPTTAARDIGAATTSGYRQEDGDRVSVSTVMVRVLVDAVEQAGVPRDELLRPQNIEPARLAEVDGRFAHKQFALLQMRAMDLTRDEALGLHIASHTHENAFALVGHLVSHAPTLREAFGLVAQFQRLLLDECHIALRETGTSATLHYYFARSFDRSDRMLAEFVVASLLRFVRFFGGPNVAPQLASFEHARPAHHRKYTRLFGDVVRFGQHATGLTFDRALLDRVQLHQHPELYSLLRSHAELALERVANGVGPADQVKRYLLARPPARIPDISTAARDLGLSARSLRRRLAAAATSYRALVRATLQASAGHMLRDPKQTIQETAHALGFSNVGAFHRAFKRWTGMTPAQYRERRNGKAADPVK
jgi:AraC-like DNA-binding protein